MIDLHLHTTASDGRLPPAELVACAADAGLTIISVTDHDTTAGLAAAREAGRQLGVDVVSGIEITAVEEGRDVHVLGYFFDDQHAGLAAFLQSQRSDRVRRLREIAQRLDVLGFPVNLEPAFARTREFGSVGRPLVADALLAAGHVADRREAFDRLLGTGRPAFVPRRGAHVAEVITLIRSAGGVASLAHPGLTHVDERIAQFAGAGLAAVEARHSEHDPLTEQRYRQLASRLGLAVSGGSDFHGDPGRHGNMLGVVTLDAVDFEQLRARAARTASTHPRDAGGSVR